MNTVGDWEKHIKDLQNRNKGILKQLVKHTCTTTAKDVNDETIFNSGEEKLVKFVLDETNRILDAIAADTFKSIKTFYLRTKKNILADLPIPPGIVGSAIDATRAEIEDWLIKNEKHRLTKDMKFAKETVSIGKEGWHWTPERAKDAEKKAKDIMSRVLAYHKMLFMSLVQEIYSILRNDLISELGPRIMGVRDMLSQYPDKKLLRLVTNPKSQKLRTQIETRLAKCKEGLAAINDMDVDGDSYQSYHDEF